MFDRLSEVLGSLNSPEINAAFRTASDEQEESVLYAAWLRDFKGVIEWRNLLHSLKFAGLVYPPGSPAK